MDDLSIEADGGERFIDTPTSRIVRSAVEFVRDRRGRALVVGAPGVGKTFTLMDIVRHDDRARLITATPANSKLKSFLGMVANVFHIHTSREHSADIEQTLWWELRRNFAPEGYYLIIDEAQTLELDTFRTAQHLFEQLADRLFYHVTVAGHTREDIIAFDVDYNVEGKDAHDLLVRFGLETSLRQVSVLLQEARHVAGPSGSIRLPHLNEALIFLRGPDAVRQLKKGMNTDGSD